MTDWGTISYPGGSAPSSEAWLAYQGLFLAVQVPDDDVVNKFTPLKTILPTEEVWKSRPT